MAFLEFPNVRIAGIAAGVPAAVCRNDSIGTSDYAATDFVEATGVRETRRGDFTTSDLGLAAAEQLIADLGWEKKSIEALVFVSQTADYVLPATACVLQDKLGLSRECYALDVSLGCSGWTYGLTVVAGLLSARGITRALLIAGDAKRRVDDAHLDFVSNSLFGFAGTATALEYSEGAPGLRCHVGTDGSGYDAIILPGGGARNPFNEHSLEPELCPDGVMRCPLATRMKGMDVFAFGITTAPKTVKKLLKQDGKEMEDIDYFVFHQANLKMNEQIRKKLKLEPERVPYCMDTFGNTSSASIPLTIVTRMAEPCRSRHLNIVACGFGVGLSWATVFFETDGIVISELVELD